MTNATYYPGPENATTPVKMLQYINSDLTGGMFGVFTLVGLFMIMFLMQKNYPTDRAFTSSAFTTAIASYFLFILELVPVGAVLTTTVMLVVSVFLLYSNER